MYISKAETDQIENIVSMSIRAFETDVNVGGVKGDCPPGFDSIEWHKQMALEGHLYQAMIEKDLVGAAIIFPDETNNSIYIGRIFIDSVHHRKGYGISLMECIEKNFPCALKFNLDTPCWNERTNAFYQRLGYRIIKVEDGFNFYQKRGLETHHCTLIKIEDDLYKYTYSPAWVYIRRTSDDQWYFEPLGNPAYHSENYSSFQDCLDKAYDAMIASKL